MSLLCVSTGCIVWRGAPFGRDASILQWILGLNVHSCKLSQFLKHPQLGNCPLGSFSTLIVLLPVWDCSLAGIYYIKCVMGDRSIIIYKKDLIYWQTDSKQFSEWQTVRLSVHAFILFGFFTLSNNLFSHWNDFRVPLTRLFPSLHQEIWNILNLKVVLLHQF